MKRRISHWIYRIFTWLYQCLSTLAPVDGNTPTLVRLKAVKPATFVVPVQHAPTQRISHLRSNVHLCLPPGDMPWTGGTWYCPLCRKTRVYIPVSLPREEATAPHYVPRVRGRHNGHLRYTSGMLIDTGKLQPAGRRP